MLIDWLTTRLPFEHMHPDMIARLRAYGDRVQCVDMATGEVKWEKSAWESVRSDSHTLTFRIGTDAFWLQGSPARCIGNGCNVFGSGAAAALDLAGCHRAMVGMICRHLSIVLPLDPVKWKVSRIDITQNLLLDSLESVRAALSVLRDCEGGRYRVSQQAGDTVYWSHRSALRSGKAYAKGPHLTYQLKNRKYTGPDYSPQLISKANRLLRLELKLAAQWFRERLKINWYALTPQLLQSEWHSYFSRMIGNAVMKKDDDVQTRIYAVAEKPSQARAAYSMWLLIQAHGWQVTRDTTSKSTWYRNLKVLHSAGLGDLDISKGKVVHFRQKIIEAQQVNSWADISLAA
jgi:II/X family phage/plasmid replication protein